MKPQGTIKNQNEVKKLVMGGVDGQPDEALQAAAEIAKKSSHKTKVEDVRNNKSDVDFCLRPQNLKGEAKGRVQALLKAEETALSQELDRRNTEVESRVTVQNENDVVKDCWLTIRGK